MYFSIFVTKTSKRPKCIFELGEKSPKRQKIMVRSIILRLKALPFSVTFDTYCRLLPFIADYWLTIRERAVCAYVSRYIVIKIKIKNAFFLKKRQNQGQISPNPGAKKIIVTKFALFFLWPYHKIHLWSQMMFFAQVWRPFSKKDINKCPFSISLFDFWKK